MFLALCYVSLSLFFLAFFPPQFPLGRRTACDIYWHGVSFHDNENIVSGQVNKFPGISQILPLTSSYLATTCSKSHIIYCSMDSGFCYHNQVIVLSYITQALYSEPTRVVKMVNSPSLQSFCLLWNWLHLLNNLHSLSTTCWKYSSERLVHIAVWVHWTHFLAQETSLRIFEVNDMKLYPAGSRHQKLGKWW